MDEVKWLMAREIPRLRRFALTLVDSPEEADDLVQDCLERAMRKRHLWRRRGSIRNWLYRILYNVFLNQGGRRRRRKQQISVDDMLESDTGLTVPASQEYHLVCQEIGQALKQLPADQRAAIMLVAVEGLPYDEAASVTGVPIGTLRSRLSRGRESLRELYTAREADTRLRRVK